MTLEASHLSAVGDFHTGRQGVRSRTIQQARWTMVVKVMQGLNAVRCEVLNA